MSKNEIVISSLKELYDHLSAKIEHAAIREAHFRNDKIDLEVYKLEKKIKYRLEKKIKRLGGLVFVFSCTLIGLYVGVWIMVLK